MSVRHSAVRRRLPVLLCTGLLVVVMAGCTRGTTTIPRNRAGALISCPEAGKSDFVPGPGTTHVRLQVLRSTATVPLYGLLLPNIGWYEPLWDGTQSTGPQEFAWGVEPIQDLWLRTSTGWPLANAADTTWAITALDRTGKDVGITCAPATPSS